MPRTAGAILATSAFLAAGCQTRCFLSVDCGAGSFCSPEGRCETECFSDLDCLMPPACQGNLLRCEPNGFRCNPDGKCIGDVPRPKDDLPPYTAPIPDHIDGYDDPPGTGLMFVIDTLAIASPGRGFDFDGKCRGAGECVDNALGDLGELAKDEINRGVREGQSLILVELAGLDPDYAGNEEILTVKVYAARDANLLVADNFRRPSGSDICCEFEISQQSLDATGQALARAPARVDRGRLSLLRTLDLTLVIPVGSPYFPRIELRRARMSAILTGDPLRIEDALLGGAVPMSSLSGARNPFCGRPNVRCPMGTRDSTLLDLISGISAPDIDLDNPPDGLERLRLDGATGRVIECWDGCTTNTCTPARIPPVVPGDPASCALSTEMADGYSMTLAFTAVPAQYAGTTR